MNLSAPTKAQIKMTDDAIQKVWQLVRFENTNAPSVLLRVAIQGGGCSGFQYDFTFENKKQNDDLHANFLLSDKRSLRFNQQQRQRWQSLCHTQQWIDNQQNPLSCTNVIKNTASDTNCLVVLEQFFREHAPQKYPWISVIIDPISHLYLSQATLDYLFDAQGERFIVINPNAATTCGCGSSFSV
jgi:Fe-S cluster assembly iron-binding protein IscA